MPRTVQEIADEIKQHYADNPRHGVGCSDCDGAARDLREILKPLLSSMDERLKAADADGPEWTAFRAFRYVIQVAIKERY